MCARGFRLLLHFSLSLNSIFLDWFFIYLQLSVQPACNRSWECYIPREALSYFDQVCSSIQPVLLFLFFLLSEVEGRGRSCTSIAEIKYANREYEISSAREVEGVSSFLSVRGEAMHARAANLGAFCIFIFLVLLERRNHTRVEETKLPMLPTPSLSAPIAIPSHIAKYHFLH